jgi:hypothetical protein
MDEMLIELAIPLLVFVILCVVFAVTTVVLCRGRNESNQFSRVQYTHQHMIHVAK